MLFFELSCVFNGINEDKSTSCLSIIVEFRYAARSFIVGQEYSLFRFREWLYLLFIFSIILIPLSECPPISKKLSAIQIFLIPNPSENIVNNSCSIRSLGAI